MSVFRKSTTKRGQRFLQKIGAPSSGTLTAKSVIGRIFAALGTVILSLLIFLLGLTYVLCKGPSVTVRDLFVSTVMETSAAKFVAKMYFSEDEIAHILKKNTIVETDEVTDLTNEFTSEADAPPKDTIELVDVSGPTFKGKMMIVHDPSRVRLAVAKEFSNDVYGRRVEEFVADEGAIAGVNGGGFMDEGGVGKGGMPLGLVIKDGKILNGSPGTKDSIVGFDQNDHLVVGSMTGAEALELGVRDAVAFGPAFIVNGKPLEVVGSGGGLNPRTVLGQRADGAVLLLVIDGRQPHSIGASLKDCMDVMLQFEAVNAGNLDGGSSSLMVYEVEIITVCASLYGSRKLPTAFIVK